VNRLQHSDHHMESASSAILDTLYSLIFAEDEGLESQTLPPETILGRANETDSGSVSSILEKGAIHVFQESTFTIPTFCNYCKEYIWGFTQQGHFCSVCGYTTHAKCTPKAPHTCRPKLSSMLKQNLKMLETVNDAVGSPKLPSACLDREQHIVFRHHLVEGNLPLGVDCDICNESFELFGTNGYRCSRCEKIVHSDCRKVMDNEGCRPRHQRLFYIDPVMNIDDHNEQKPLIVFVNGRSGGQYGGVLIHEFTRLLDRSQVFDLNVDNGAEKGLMRYIGTNNLRILVCGGDGTAGWVLSTLDKLSLDVYPPIGILPLGTGNDLSRTLGWGTGYNGEYISPILDAIHQSKIVNLDRWKVVFDHQHKEGILNNYMSIGVDAEVALEFHNLRNNQPELFTSTFVNKFWYANYGVKSMFSDIDELGANITLEVDGHVISLPSGVGGVMILNLPSYAGGSNLWGETDNNAAYSAQAIDDKMLEIVAITGSFHMGTIHVNLSQAIRIGQGNHIKVKLLQKLPIQVDGEPWLQEPSNIDISFYNQAKMLYKSSESRIFTTNMDNDDHHIIVQQNNILSNQITLLKVIMNNHNIIYII